MNQVLRGFRIKSNTGFHGVKHRRAGLVVAAKGGVYPFCSCHRPRLLLAQETASITSMI